MLTRLADMINEYFATSLFLVIILSLAMYFIYLVIYRFILKGKKKISFKRIVLFIMFVIYIFLVLYVTLFSRRRFDDKSNFELFRAYKRAVFQLNWTSMFDIIQNILMFLPFGFLLPFTHKIFYNPFVVIITSSCFSSFIEIMQYINHCGYSDMDDIFNNVLGTIVGYCIAMIIISIVIDDKYKYRNIMLAILTLFIIGLALFTLALLYKQIIIINI